jgi:hypothetical protein
MITDEKIDDSGVEIYDEGPSIDLCAHPDGCPMPRQSGDIFCSDCRSIWDAAAQLYVEAA